MCMPGGHWATRYSSLEMQCRHFSWMAKVSPVAGWRNHVLCYLLLKVMLGRKNKPVLFENWILHIFNKVRCSTWSTLLRILGILLCKCSKSHVDYFWPLFNYRGASPCHQVCVWLATKQVLCKLQINFYIGVSNGIRKTNLRKKYNLKQTQSVAFYPSVIFFFFFLAEF